MSFYVHLFSSRRVYFSLTILAFSSSSPFTYPSQHLESVLVWPVGQGPNASAEEDAVEDAEEEVKEGEGEEKAAVNGK